MKGKMKLLTKESWQQNPNTMLNIDLKKEATLRKESIKFMLDLGQNFLHLPLSTVQKSIVIFQRYCQSVSFRDFDRFMTGSVSILLMAKDDYHQKRLEDLIKAFLIVAQKMRLIQMNKYIDPHRLDTKEQQEAYISKLNPKVIAQQVEPFQNTEIELLQMTGYDLQVDVTQKYLDFFKKTSTLIDDRVVFQDVVNLAEENTITIYMSNLCLYYHPIILTIVAIQSACDKLNVNLPSEPEGTWWNMFSTRISKAEVQECSEAYYEFLKYIN